MEELKNDKINVMMSTVKIVSSSLRIKTIKIYVSFLHYLTQLINYFYMIEKK